jgi:hypothetical protein
MMRLSYILILCFAAVIAQSCKIQNERSPETVSLFLFAGENVPYLFPCINYLPVITDFKGVSVEKRKCLKSLSEFRFMEFTERGNDSLIARSSFEKICPVWIKVDSSFLQCGAICYLNLFVSDADVIDSSLMVRVNRITEDPNVRSILGCGE